MFDCHLIAGFRYYLIRVENFQDMIEADLDEWIYML